eukprot:TRINITY_DN6063_c0_g1_i1.p1 TRINITY_DN6063_c0_g1~~TRINITY_DN6063_c0_g1_i1.p1  ORF type:complete len:468 (+),score=139.01 TRINITY_DN6063_c0_g1_i1:70-1473(+)
MPGGMASNAMDDLCAAFSQLAADCETGTMARDLPSQGAAKWEDPRLRGSGRTAGGRMGMSARFAPARPTWRQTPYGGSRVANQAVENATLGLAGAITEMVDTPMANESSCGCPPASWANMLRLVRERMSIRRRWDEAPVEEVRQTISRMARDGTEDNQLCVPWRLTYNRAPDALTAEPPQDGQRYPAPFVIVAPSPEEYYHGETIVYTPRVKAETVNCLVAVLGDIECKFKALWEMSHLMSLRSSPADYELRMPYTRRLLADLKRSRSNPDLTPWAITRPYARPSDAVARPVPLPTRMAGYIVYTAPVGLPSEYVGEEEKEPATVEAAFKDLLADEPPELQGTIGTDGQAPQTMQQMAALAAQQAQLGQVAAAAATPGAAPPELAAQMAAAAAPPDAAAQMAAAAAAAAATGAAPPDVAAQMAAAAQETALRMAAAAAAQESMRQIEAAAAAAAQQIADAAQQQVST